MSNDQVLVTPTTSDAQRKPRKYVPALGPRMHAVLWTIFLLCALLGASGVYLIAVRGFEFYQGRSYQSQFSLWMFLVHIVAGLAILVPFIPFGIAHWHSSKDRTNRKAIRWGVALFAVGIAIGLSGLALVQLEALPQLAAGSMGRIVTYWIHVIAPLAAVAVYVVHRKAGPKIRWKWGAFWGGATIAFTAIMIAMHSHDPRKWNARGSPEGEKYFEPSAARTVDGKFLSASSMMMDEYCLQCHGDVYKSHLHSAHRNSSFNNPAYRFSVRETRQKSGVRAARWCAGCHDPVPFFSGEFDDPNYDDVNHPTASAGVTCTVCHAITHVGSRSGNADYTIEEPIHYPLATSENSVLNWVSQQMVKAKPEFHKKTFLKPFHRTEAFCSTCHKVGLPQEVNRYKEFLRGQNHNDSFWLSGVSGHGARSFYYPAQAKTGCNDCHMPLQPSRDFGSRDFDGSGIAKIHDHTFVAANTGLAALLKFPGHEDAIRKHGDFLRGGPDGKSPPLRIDLFGLKELHVDRLRGAATAFGLAADPMHAISIAAGADLMRVRGVEAPLLGDRPLRPQLPKLIPGSSYMVEVVIRTLNMGHHFTQGTVDSNEVWVEFHAKTPKRTLGRSGAMAGADRGRVNPWSHFLNALVLDRHGNRIDRRNPQDIFTPLYDHQIAPGSAQVVHYQLDVPADLQAGESIDVSVRVRYRKFDDAYMTLVHGKEQVPQLPIVDLCEDRIVFPVTGIVEQVPAQKSPIEPAWQRWNDYGIACFLEGGPEGKSGGELGQAEQSFRRLLSAEFSDAKAAHSHGHLNLARVHLAYGGADRLELAREHLALARKCDPPAPWWTVAWFNGAVNLQHANFDEAIRQFETILNPANIDPVRKFDFTGDFIVRNELGKTLFFRSQQETEPLEQTRLLRLATSHLEKTLQLDPENVDAHQFLAKAYHRLCSDFPLDQVRAIAFDGSVIEGLKRAQEGAITEAADAIRDIVSAVKKAPANEESLRGWMHLRQELVRMSNSTTDEWRRLALQPALRSIDAQVLAFVPELAQSFSAATTDADRRRLAQMLGRAITSLGERPRRADVRPSLLALASWPQGATSPYAALLGLAELDVLGGGMPPTRLLALQKTHQRVRGSRAETDSAMAHVLARLHLALHGIFKPDENAQEHAVRIHRSRFPAADRASHPIVIYRLNEPFTQ